MHVRSHALRATFVAGLALFAARPAHAQALAPHMPRADVAAAKPASSVSTTPATSGPTMASASVAVRPVETKDLQLNAAAAPRRAGYGQPVAFMVVGGAALITGLIIGGDAGTIIAVGGTAMGLYGLFEYLQ